MQGFGGNDLISGGSGNDVYVYAAGDGSDIIEDNGGSSDVDIIEISGYGIADLSFERLSEGSDDLVIRFSDTQDTITIMNTLGGSGSDQIEQIVLTDSGEILTLDQIRDALFFDAATDRGDVIYGTAFDDTITGGAGPDVMDGAGGNDTYVYHAGDGEDRISDSAGSNADKLLLADYNVGDISTIRRSPGNGNDILIIFTTIEGAEFDSIVIEDSLLLNNDGIESIEFADGTTWTIQDVRDQILSGIGTSNDEAIWGFDSDDTIFGQEGDDHLSGGDGSDDYIYRMGDGNDVIEDNGDGDNDRIIIQDYSSLEASVSRYYLADDGFVIRFAGNDDDSLTVLNSLSGRADDTIEEIVFSDGVIWTMADILLLLENNAPVAERDGFYSVVQGEPSILFANDLLINDFDPDGEPLTVIAVGNAVGGVVQLDENNNIVFTADEGYIGAASFEYTISDGNNGLASAIVNLRVRPPATAIDDNGFTVNEDSTLTISSDRLLANDIDGDIMILSAVENAIGGTVTLSSTGDVTFIPFENFNGLAQFDYVANTPDGGRAVATVFIEVLPVNDAPVAVNDTGFTTLEDQPLVIDTLDLLANDTDIDGDILTIVDVIGDANVTATLLEDGTIYVEPNAFYFGDATLTYTIEDPDGLQSTATVSVYVEPVNNAPEPVADQFETDEDTPLFLSTDELLINDIEHDGDTLTITRMFGASHGTVELFENGTFLFTPSANFYGQAGFYYEVSDGQGGLSTAFVAVQVNPVNDAPEPRTDRYSDDNINFLNGVEDQTLVIAAIDLLANDTDIDSLSLSLETVSTAVNGTVTINVDGNVEFTPDADFWGEASFYYTVSDSEGAVAQAQVILYIAPVSDAPPVANDDNFEIFEDVVTVISAADILANDTDIDGDELTIISVSGPAYLDENGNVVVTPPLNSTSGLFIDYTVSDGFDGTDSATIYVDIIPVNDAPFAIEDSFESYRDLPIVLRISDLLGNDYDLEDTQGIIQTALTFLSAQNTSEGSISVYGDEFVVIEIADGFTGEVSFDYTISDSDGATDTAVVTGAVLDERPDTITGTSDRDLLIGSRFGETIEGLDGNDDIFAREGDDFIIGGDGGDNIDGGSGIDTISYSGSNIGIRVDLETRLGQGGHAQGDLITDVENIIGTEYQDQLFGDLNVNVLTGLGGSDTLDGRAGDDILDGGAGDDELIGGIGADDLRGGEGADTANYADSDAAVTVSLITGTGTGGHAEGDILSGIENLDGSLLDDTLIGDDQDNVLSGSRGDDTLIGGLGNDVLIGGQGADNFDGGEGIDTADYSGSASGVTVDMSGATAGGGDATGDIFTSIERVHGSHQDDVLIGDDGDNVLRGNDGADDIQGGAGYDIADYSNADTAITIDLEAGTGTGGDAEGDTLSGIEQITAGNYNDSLLGSAGSDVFEGGIGDDAMAGRGGSDDYLFGYGSGNDTVVESGDLPDIDRIVMDDDVLTQHVSLIQDGDDLILELEDVGGILIDTIRVSDHFLGAETGIENIVFADGTVYDRATILHLWRRMAALMLKMI